MRILNSVFLANENSQHESNAFSFGLHTRKSNSLKYKAAQRLQHVRIFLDAFLERRREDKVVLGRKGLCGSELFCAVVG